MGWGGGGGTGLQRADNQVMHGASIKLVLLAASGYVLHPSDRRSTAGLVSQYLMRGHLSLVEAFNNRC